MRKHYIIQTFKQPRGTAGASALIPEITKSIRELGGDVIETHIMGPHLLALVEMDSSHYGEVQSWHAIEDIHLYQPLAHD